MNATTTTPPAGRSPFSRLFLRGLGVLLPAIVTMWILWSVGSFLYARIAEPINALVRTTTIHAVPHLYAADQLPPWYNVTDAQVSSS